MGINSTEVAYGFGQMGSAYSDNGQYIVPPKDHVIVAITFLADNTPTVLNPERLDQNGPGFVAIADAGTDHPEAEGNNYFNWNGVWTSEITNGTYAAGAEITLNNLPTDLGRIRVGQYVLMTANDADADGNPTLNPDLSNGPVIPIYNGPNKQGTTVTD
jgi:hypothetical protein